MRYQEDLHRGETEAVITNRKGWEMEEQHLNPYHVPEPVHHFTSVISFIPLNRSLK